MNEPLGLPKGSVRAIISLMIITGGILSMFFTEADTQNKMLNLVLAVVAFYFGSKIPTK